VKEKIKAGIIGGAGYTGGETIRLLLSHPSVTLSFVQSRSQAGKPLADVHRDLAGETFMTFVADSNAPVDVIFLCLSHGESQKLLHEQSFPTSTKVIDLGNDFRLGHEEGGRKFIYGLPELQRDAIKKSSNVANPGCFATTIQLGLMPLAAKGLLNDVYTTGVTGSTGAGQKLQDTTHFTWRSDNISAYKTLTHQHLGEIQQTLNRLQSGWHDRLFFVPWRGDFTRGIFVSSTTDADLSLEDANKTFKAFYQGHPFTHIADSMIDMKQVVNTNKCLIFIEKVGKKLVVHSALDNLLKGASGQAVQNMNLMFGLDETEGLKLKGSIF
jgi:N-acetyl-gamma-glutamyl-phosphate reductase